MDFFLHPFCLLVCLLIIFYGFVFSLPAFISGNFVFNQIVWLLFFNFSIGNNSRHSVDKISSETFRHVCYKVYSFDASWQ